jgi:hypothetical protein
MRYEEFTRIYLSSDAWKRLYGLTTRPFKNNRQGWPNRYRLWRERLRSADYSVLLSHTEHNGHPDDMTFIARAIEQDNIVGWQWPVFDIFHGTHPRFIRRPGLPPNTGPRAMYRPTVGMLRPTKIAGVNL